MKGNYLLKFHRTFPCTMGLNVESSYKIYLGQEAALTMRSFVLCQQSKTSNIPTDEAGNTLRSSKAGQVRVGAWRVKGTCLVSMGRCLYPGHTDQYHERKRTQGYQSLQFIKESWTPGFYEILPNLLKTSVDKLNTLAPWDGSSNPGLGFSTVQGIRRCLNG